MKSFWISFLGIFVSAFFVGWIGYWWIIFIPCLLFGLLVNRKASSAFWSGFFAIAILWKLMALYWISKDSVYYYEQVLKIFTEALPAMASWSPKVVLLSIVSLIGGMAGGLVTWAGQALRKI